MTWVSLIPLSPLAALLCGASAGMSAGPLAVASAMAFTEGDTLADDASLSVSERLDRLERRIVELEALAADVTSRDAVIGKAIDDGKRLVAVLEQKVKVFKAAAATSTMTAAAGGGEARSLGWLCQHARTLAPRLTSYTSAIAQVLDRFPPKLAAIPIGSEGAGNALLSLSAELQATVDSRLADESTLSLRGDLRELGRGLPFAWGAYNTLVQLADDTDQSASELSKLLQTFAFGKDGIEYRIRSHLREKDDIWKTLGAIHPEYSEESGRINALQSRCKASHLPGLKRQPLDIVEAAKFWSDKWSPIVQQAYAAVEEAMRPLRTQVAGGIDPRAEPMPDPPPAQGCEGLDDPSRLLADVLAEGRRPLTAAFDRLERAISTRANEVDEALRRAQDVAKTNQETVTDLDRKLALVKERGQKIAADDDVGQKKLRALLDQGNKLRGDAAQALARVELAMTGLRAEGRAVSAQRAAVAAIKSRLLAELGSAGDGE